MNTSLQTRAALLFFQEHFENKRILFISSELDQEHTQFLLEYGALEVEDLSKASSRRSYYDLIIDFSLPAALPGLDSLKLESLFHGYKKYLNRNGFILTAIHQSLFENLDKKNPDIDDVHSYGNFAQTLSKNFKSSEVYCQNLVGGYSISSPASESLDLLAPYNDLLEYETTATPVTFLFCFGYQIPEIRTQEFLQIPAALFNENKEETLSIAENERLMNQLEADFQKALLNKENVEEKYKILEENNRILSEQNRNLSEQTIRNNKIIETESTTTLSTEEEKYYQKKYLQNVTSLNNVKKLFKRYAKEKSRFHILYLQQKKENRKLKQLIEQQQQSLKSASDNNKSANTVQVHYLKSRFAR